MRNDPWSSCLGTLARAFFDIILGGMPSVLREEDSGGPTLWKWLQFTGSVLVYPLTFGKVWLSDQHEVLAGLIGIAFYAALLSWAIPFFIQYGKQ